MVFEVKLKRKFDTTELALLKRYLFDKAFNIQTGKDALSRHKYNDKTSIHRSYSIYDLIDVFSKNKIYQTTGITLLEFLNMNQMEIELLLTHSAIMSKSNSDALNLELNKLNMQ